MNFTEKLRRLIGDQKAAHIAKRAGLRPTAFTEYISKGYQPRADIALKMARALNAPVEWLIDDAQGWPPPKIDDKPAASVISDRDLMLEVAARRRRRAMEFLQLIDEASRMDWNAAAQQAEQLRLGEPLPQLVHHALMTAASLSVSFRRTQYDFDPQFFSALMHDDLPGSDRAPAVYESTRLALAWGRFEHQPGAKRFADAMRARPEWENIFLHGGLPAPPIQSSQPVLTVEAGENGPIPASKTVPLKDISLPPQQHSESRSPKKSHKPRR